MTAPGFEALGRELDLWLEAGRVAQFWWRDDDAVAPTPALARLLDMSDEFGVEIGVAVIPAFAEDALRETLARRPLASVLQHGYAHKNHGRPGAPAVELGGERELAQILAEISAGRRRLEALFGYRYKPIVVAPWNRIERSVLGSLAALGFSGASAFGPRAAMQGSDGLIVENIHVDPIRWRERRFKGTKKTLSCIIGELAARRTGATDADEPLGLLTHHLDHDLELWEFLERFFAFTRTRDAVRWLSIDEAFSLRASAVSLAKTSP